MKERPILFSAAMVRAILAGKKWQTRRLMKPQPPPGAGRVTHCGDGFVSWDVDAHTAVCDSWEAYMPCAPGDLYWVKETFVLQRQVDGERPPHDDGRPVREGEDDGWLQPHYRATDPVPELDMGDDGVPACKWSPSIFMPRWASRITLEVMRVWPERVQDISEADAEAEGAGWWAMESNAVITCATMAEAFAKLWDSINAKRGHGFNVNDWVWAVEFRKLDAKEGGHR